MTRADPDYPSTMQILEMLRILGGRGSRSMKIKEIARRLDVHVRTVKRYITALNKTQDNDQGEPLVRRELRDGEAWAVLSRREEPISASIFQYAATWAAACHLAHGGTVLGESVDDVLRRIEAEFEPRTAALLDRVATAFYYVPFGPKSYADNQEVIDDLVTAVLYQQVLTIHYQALGAEEPTARRVEPYTMLMYRDGLYLLGRCEGQMRIYAAGRIRGTETTGERFELPEDFHPAKLFRDRLGLWQSAHPPELVRLAFAAGAARVAQERDMPGGATWSEAPDGRAILEMRIPVTPEVCTWVLGWADQVEVLAPASLRAEVGAALQAALAPYVAPTPSELDP